ncbi:MAG TPA: phosphoribosylformylglycinamidine synthase subunit PurQ [Drouetiella sp.]
MQKPVAIVLCGDGINCDAETSWALSLSGFEPSPVHVSDLLTNPGTLEQSQMLVIPGGFSYGDEIASGKVLALKLKERLRDALYSYIDKGNLVMGICNGFQVLVQLGLLPFSGENDPRIVSLVRNTQMRFVNKWVRLQVFPDVNHRFFTSLREIELPIRHGEGRLALEPLEAEAIESVEQTVRRLAPLRYVDEINGSFDKIAALSNPAGNVLGLMPHPEAFVRWTQNPAWTQRQIAIKHFDRSQAIAEIPHGLAIFSNAAASLN